MEYPDLKRTVRDHAVEFHAKNILIEDKACGTPLIQELIREGIPGITRCLPKMEKRIRLQSITPTIENGSVFLPEKAPWLAEYLHELATFPNGTYDDQVDSTSQALDWIKDRSLDFTWMRQEARRLMIEEGRLEEVKEMDEKDGAPPEEPKTPPPSGPAVYRR